MTSEKALSIFPHGFLFVTFLFLLIFPKGGFRLGEVPITWGYSFLCAFTFLFFLSQKKFHLSRDQKTALFALIPLQAFFLFHISYEGCASLGFTIAFLLSFYLLPWIFLSFLSEIFAHMNLMNALDALKKSVFFTAVIGIALLLSFYLLGKIIHIPFLTINAGDLDISESSKCNARGVLLKLYSTFQNGNIYGVAISIFLPLFYLLEKSWWKKRLVFLALFLTLSRTVWATLIVCEILNTLYVNKIKLSSLLLLGFKLAAVGAIAYAVTLQMSKDSDFLLDSTLGGRDHQLEVLKEWTLFGDSVPFPGIGEMIYFEVLKYLGLIGLLSFCIGILAPLGIFFLKTPLKRQAPHKKALAAGLILYLFAAVSDGALLFIPVLAFYWLAASLLLQEFHVDQICTSQA